RSDVPVRRSIRQVRNAGERRNSTTPTSENAAAHATASPAELSATSTATSMGPAMNMTSMSTESSENAVESEPSSAKRWRKYVRIHTVIGGNVAPAATANVSSQPDPGVVAVHGRHEGCKRSGKSERAKREQ